MYYINEFGIIHQNEKDQYSRYVKQTYLQHIHVNFNIWQLNTFYVIDKGYFSEAFLFKQKAEEKSFI